MMTSATASSSSSFCAPPSSSSSSSYKEHITVAPFRVATVNEAVASSSTPPPPSREEAMSSQTPTRRRFWHVRLESKHQLQYRTSTYKDSCLGTSETTTCSGPSTSTTTTTAKCPADTSTSTKLPDHLMSQSQAFNSIPSLLFPKDVIDLLRKYDATRIRIQVQHSPTTSYPIYPLDDLRNNNRGGGGGGGPSGVLVQVDFRSAHEMNKQQQRFEDLLRELHDRRYLLAPVVSSRSRISKRKQPRPLLHSSPSNDVTNSNHSTSTRVVKVATLYIMLPFEGSPFSAEGMVAFLQHVPCHNSNHHQGHRRAVGIWSLASATEWSHLLLGTKIHNIHVIAAATASGSRALSIPPLRKLWMEATWTSLEQQQCSSNENADCSSSGNGQMMTWSQGMEFVTSTPPHRVDDNRLSMQQILPFLSSISPSRSFEQPFLTCPLADETLLTLVGSKATAKATSSVDTIPLNSSTCWTDPLPVTATSWHEGGQSWPIGVPRWQVEYQVQRQLGQAHRGSLTAILINNDPHCAAQVQFQHVLPLVIQPIWDSWTVRIHNATHTRSLPWSQLDDKQLDLDSDVSFGGHGTKNMLRYAFHHTVPPQTQLELAFEYHPMFLSFETFPADPNRGFEIPPFVAHFTRSTTCVQTAAATSTSSDSATLYSQSNLLMAPVPDLSMPFNVLSLTCTLYAFVIGSMLTLITRKASERIKYTLHPESKPPNSLKQKITQRIHALRAGLVRRTAKLRRSIRTTTDGDSNEKSKHQKNDLNFTNLPDQSHKK